MGMSVVVSSEQVRKAQEDAGTAETNNVREGGWRTKLGEVDEMNSLVESQNPTGHSRFSLSASLLFL